MQVIFSVCFLYTTRVKCLLNKAAPHLLLPSMVCFDRVQPVMSLRSFCTSWRAGWAETGNVADEARHGDVSASGTVACRSQGACWYEAKVWGYLSHTSSQPASAPSESRPVFSLFYLNDFSLQICYLTHTLAFFSLLLGSYFVPLLVFTK